MCYDIYDLLLIFNSISCCPDKYRDINKRYLYTLYTLRGREMNTSRPNSRCRCRRSPKLDPNDTAQTRASTRGVAAPSHTRGFGRRVPRSDQHNGSTLNRTPSPSSIALQNSASTRLDVRTTCSRQSHFEQLWRLSVGSSDWFDRTVTTRKCTFLLYFMQSRYTRIQLRGVAVLEQGPFGSSPTFQMEAFVREDWRSVLIVLMEIVLHKIKFNWTMNMANYKLLDIILFTI